MLLLFPVNSKITILIEPDQEFSLYQPVLVRGNFFSEFPFPLFCLMFCYFCFLLVTCTCVGSFPYLKQFQYITEKQREQ